MKTLMLLCCFIIGCQFEPVVINDPHPSNQPLRNCVWSCESGMFSSWENGVECLCDATNTVSLHRHRRSDPH